MLFALDLVDIACAFISRNTSIRYILPDLVVSVSIYSVACCEQMSEILLQVNLAVHK